MVSVWSSSPSRPVFGRAAHSSRARGQGLSIAPAGTGTGPRVCQTEMFRSKPLLLETGRASRCVRRPAKPFPGAPCQAGGFRYRLPGFTFFSLVSDPGLQAFRRAAGRPSACLPWPDGSKSPGFLFLAAREFPFDGGQNAFGPSA